MTARLVFDASRLMDKADRSFPTGVDRVCLAYAEWLISKSALPFIPVRRRRNGLRLVDRDVFEVLVSDLRRKWDGSPSWPDPLEAPLLKAIQTPWAERTAYRSPPKPNQESRRRRKTLMHLRSRRLKMGPDHLYLNVGHTGLEHGEFVENLAASGCRSAIFLHDLIPLTHPEYCRPGDDAKHGVRVSSAVRLAELIITNSRYTADEFRKYCSANALSAPDVVVAPLGLESPFIDHTSSWAPAPAPYFVYVGTIEGRKNLAFMLTIWRELAHKLGSGAPQLVLAGKMGWEKEAVLDLLERAPALQSLVHHVEGLGDVALRRLVAGSRALIAPSSVEGFDLPAAEASAMGVPVLASDIPPHREIVPSARFIDPVDGPSWINAVESALTNPISPFVMAKPSGWSDHFENIAGPAIQRLCGLSAPDPKTQ